MAIKERKLFVQLLLHLLLGLLYEYIGTKQNCVEIARMIGLN